MTDEERKELHAKTMTNLRRSIILIVIAGILTVINVGLIGWRSL